MLTHELSDAASWDLGSYSEHFWPVKPQLLYGRSAKMTPQCPVEHAVWYGWRDFGCGKFISSLAHIGSFCLLFVLSMQKLHF